MAQNRILYYSERLNMEIGVNVLIPENKWGFSLADRPKDYKYPVLWLLSGGGYNYSDWLRFTALELYAATKGIAVVTPSAYASGYMDTVHGDYEYFSVIAEELPQFIQGMFPISTKREDNFLAGFSMGGYGAFKFSMWHPEMFAACGVFSGPIGIVPRQPMKHDFNSIGLREDENEPVPEGFRTMMAAFGSARDRRNTKDDNLYMLEQHLAKGDYLPKYYISTGQEDAIAGDNYETANLLHKMGLEFEDVRDHGQHNWEYCNRKVWDYLNWIPLGETLKMQEA